MKIKYFFLFGLLFSFSIISAQEFGVWPDLGAGPYFQYGNGKYHTNMHTRDQQDYKMSHWALGVKFEGGVGFGLGNKILSEITVLADLGLSLGSTKGKNINDGSTDTSVFGGYAGGLTELKFFQGLLGLGCGVGWGTPFSYVRPQISTESLNGIWKIQFYCNLPIQENYKSSYVLGVAFIFRGSDGYNTWGKAISVIK